MLYFYKYIAITNNSAGFPEELQEIMQDWNLEWIVLVG